MQFLGALILGLSVPSIISKGGARERKGLVYPFSRWER